MQPRVRFLAERASGVAALDQGRLVGFLLGLTFSGEFGPMAWIPDVGHGVDGDAGLYGRLYAAASAPWARGGFALHDVTLFAAEPDAVRVFGEIGFGTCVYDAVRTLAPLDKRPPEVDVQRVDASRLDDVMSLQKALHAHLKAPPIYLPLAPEPDREKRAAWLADPQNAMWVAFVDGRAVSGIGMQPTSGTVTPNAVDRRIAFSFASTLPVARRTGVASAVLDRALAWARDEGGYETASVDFESANVNAAGFWFGHGFRMTTRSLRRKIG